MLSSYPLWWLALPVLLLPVWWHRQKRQRVKAELLATARFLPSAPPEQLRVWQWRDKLLLLVRCLLLMVLIAWLAATIFPWRGDTVLVDAGADRAWVEEQIKSAGFTSATRIDMPADVLPWLRENERDWQRDAKLLIVARAGQIAMPARLPQFSHPVELRTKPVGSRQSAAPVDRHIVLGAPQTRAQPWRFLFAAFDVAGGGVARHVLDAAPDARTALIVWDTPGTVPPAAWRSTHWWVVAPTVAEAAGEAGGPFPELAAATALTVNGIHFKYADTPRGRLWTSDVFPPRDADTARALYDSWQLLSAAPAPAYATPSQTVAAERNAAPIPGAMPAAWLALAMLALFMIERILSHARRN
ncbi:hypothetical protein E4L98_12035 [Duganella callida]|uniref:Aerotolerance regulator N-terminal domain-containing protein n=2 Tax=Duganella callida TaxID=2561932 RepID=A0A4Y9SLH1_9BURK|nr:hypothetical protein E4L98_12035 [Duganella callida]